MLHDCGFSWTTVLILYATFALNVRKAATVNPFTSELLGTCLSLNLDSYIDVNKGFNLKKPTDLDLHYLQRQGISGLSRTRVKNYTPYMTSRQSKP